MVDSRKQKMMIVRSGQGFYNSFIEYIFDFYTMYKLDKNKSKIL